MIIDIRLEEPSDVAVIERLTRKAFLDAPHTSHTEQFIIAELRKAGRLTISLVAVDAGDGGRLEPLSAPGCSGRSIVGHVALSPVTLSDGSDRWYGLGPIAVLPRCQGQGVGSRLVERALAELRGIGAAGCVVLGEPGFYGRFGFKAEPSLVLPDVPAEYFQAIAFEGAIPVGTVAYDAAFDA